MAARQAAQDELPGVIIHGCTFHFGQALIRNVQRLGLMIDYEDLDGQVNDLIKLLKAMCLLTVDLVILMWKNWLRTPPQVENQLLQQKFNDFATYFRTAYMKWLGKKKQECIQDMSLACQGCPKEFGNIYTALVRMQFADKPDYDYFIACQKDVMARKNFREESALDWEPQNELAKMTQVVPNATMMHNENRKRSY